MSLGYDATFDGTVFRPESLPDLEPNTRVRIVVKPLGEIKPLVIEKGEPYSFLDFAGSLKLEGPPDCGITDALTSDEHFVQAGFRALMRA